MKLLIAAIGILSCSLAFADNQVKVATCSGSLNDGTPVTLGISFNKQADGTFSKNGIFSKTGTVTQNYNGQISVDKNPCKLDLEFETSAFYFITMYMEDSKNVFSEFKIPKQGSTELDILATQYGDQAWAHVTCKSELQ